jgi:hypothetical protein
VYSSAPGNIQQSFLLNGCLFIVCKVIIKYFKKIFKSTGRGYRVLQGEMDLKKKFQDTVPKDILS